MSKFQLKVSLHESYLAGGIYEYNPALSVYSSWTSGRFSRTAPLAAGEWHDLGSYALPNALDSNHDDEVLSFTAFSQTRTSGIAAIDAKEEKYVERMIPTGVEKVDLRELLKTAVIGKEGETNLILSSPMVMRDARDHALAGRTLNELSSAERDEIGKEVMQLAAKLWIKIQVTILDRPAIDTWLNTGRPQLRSRLLYFDAKTPARLASAINALESSYVVHLTDFELSESNQAAKPIRIPWNPQEPISKDLHFFSGETPAGPLLPIAWTFQDLQNRIGDSFSITVENAAPASQTAQFLESSLLGSLWAAGMDGVTFSKVVQEQVSPARRHDSQMMSSFRTATGAVLSVATLVANQALYATDMEYPNVHALRAMTSAKQALYAPGLIKAGLIKQLGAKRSVLATSTQRVWEDAAISSRPMPAHRLHHKYCHKCNKMHSRLRTYVGAPLKAATEETPAAKRSFEATVLVTGDRWDTTINAQDTTTADCEEGGFGITANLDFMEVFLEKLGESARRARPVLESAYQILRRLTFLANGASSTEPYVAADKKNTASTHVPLPIIGSAEDQKWAENGHGFTTVQTKASWAAAMLRGFHVLPLKNVREQELLSVELEHEITSAEAWTEQLRPFILEGTGPTNMESLSVEETYAGTDRAPVFIRKSATKMAFLHRLRKGDQEDRVAAAFADIVKHESLAYELWAPLDGNVRRSHPFYRTIMHAVNPKAAREFGGVFGQVSAINLASNPGPVRAVPVGDFARMSRNVAYVSPYGADFSAREWNEKIQPTIACRMNLQQASNWARAPRQFPPKTAQLVTRSAFSQLAKSSSINHVNTTLNALPVIHASLPSDEAAALELVVNADASDIHATFQCHLPAWQVVAATHRLQGLLDAIDTLKQEKTIAGALIVREQPLWRCPATLRLIIVLNVPETLDTVMWPRPH